MAGLPFRTLSARPSPRLHSGFHSRLIAPGAEFSDVIQTFIDSSEMCHTAASDAFEKAEREKIVIMFPRICSSMVLNAVVYLRENVTSFDRQVV